MGSLVVGLGSGSVVGLGRVVVGLGWVVVGLGWVVGHSELVSGMSAHVPSK